MDRQQLTHLAENALATLQTLPDIPTASYSTPLPIHLPPMDALSTTWNVFACPMKKAIVIEGRGAVIQGRAYCVDALVFDTPLRVAIDKVTGMTGRRTFAQRLHQDFVDSLTVSMTAYEMEYRYEINDALAELTAAQSEHVAREAAVALRTASMHAARLAAFGAELSLDPDDRPRFRALLAANPDVPATDLAEAARRLAS